MAVNWLNHPEIKPEERARMIAHAQETLANPSSGLTTPRDQQLDNLIYSQFPGGASGAFGGFGGAGGTGSGMGGAPMPTPYGSFTAPDPTKLDSDPTYQYDLAQQQKAIQRGAAARGTLLTGGLQTRLQENASGVAGSHYGDIFNRALQSYDTNRATHAQNFEQPLAAFNANTSANLGYGHLNLDAGDQAFRQSQVLRGNRLEDTDRETARVENEQQALADAYAQQVAQQRQQFGTLSASGVTPPPPPFARRNQGAVQKWYGG